MRIDNAGNVGIGTDAPGGILDVFGSDAGGTITTYIRNQPNVNTADTQVAIQLPVYNGAGGLKIAQMASSTGGFNLGAFDAMISTGQDASHLHFAAGSSRTAQVTIENGGNVGINDVTPTYQLDVNGTFRAVGITTLDSTLFAPNIGTGVDNSVVILDSDGGIKTDEIDSRV